MDPKRNLIPVAIVILCIEVLLLSVQNNKLRRRVDNLIHFHSKIEKNIDLEIFPNIFVIDSSNKRMPSLMGTDLRECLLVLLSRAEYKKIIVPWVGTPSWTGLQSRFRLAVVIVDKNNEPLAPFLNSNNLGDHSGHYLLSAENIEHIKGIGRPAAFVLLPGGKIIQHILIIDADWVQSIN